MKAVDLTRRAAALLRRRSDAADQEALWLFEAATGLRHPTLVSHVRPEWEERLDELVRRRTAGEPLQYVTGVAGFRRLQLAVGPGVFIPRPETEIVASLAMACIPRGGTVVDVGTGSGAIALAIADERPDVRVIATERSASAYRWAQRNAVETGLPLELLRSDLLEGLSTALRGRVDVVVSNPPYVAVECKAQLPSEVVDHEPHDALFASEHGLGVVRRLAHDALPWLRPGGALVLEIGETQSSGARGALVAAGYERIELHHDLAGRPRAVVARHLPAGKRDRKR